MTAPNHWISCDCAKTESGFALWHNVSLVRTWTTKRGKRRGGEPTFPEAYGASLASPLALLVIEDGYIGKNKMTGSVLAFERGGVCALAQLAGADVASYQPAEWRRQVGIQVRAAASSEELKQAAMHVATWLSAPPGRRPRDRTGRWDGFHLPILKDVTHHEVEATLIGMAHMALQGWV